MITAAVLAIFTALPPIAITHVTVIDGTGKPPASDQTILIENGRFAFVVPAGSAKIPTGTKVIEGKGKFVIPGLWDMHTHLDDPELLEVKPTKSEKELQLPLMVANGVTGVRDMGGDLSLMKDWRRRIEQGTLLGPRLYFSGPLVDGPQPMWPASVAIANSNEGRKAVQELKRQGADFIKIYSLLQKDAYLAIADECKKQGITFSGHVPSRVTNIEAAEAGQKSLEHLLQLDRELADTQKVSELQKELPSGLSRFAQFKAMREIYERAYDEEKAQSFFKILKKHGTWITPTLNVVVQNAAFDATDKVMKSREVFEPAYIREWWDPNLNVHLKGAAPEINEGQLITLRIYQRILRGMIAAKVPILVGSDMGGNPHCFSGWGVHDEMALLVKSGLSPMEVIVAATSNPCRFLGIEKECGTIEKGKFADLVLLNANPLADIHNTESIDAVMKGGTFWSRSNLDGLFRKAKIDGAKRIPPKGLDDTIESPDTIRFGGG